jgi:hypothetical protein
MGDDITIGVTEIVNNIEVTAQPNDQVIDIEVIDNSDDVTLNVTPNLIEVNINKGSSFARWGSIFGNLTDQADLTNALFNKADLVDGKVPSYQLPSFVDDVIEVADFASLPTVGEIGKIYITLDNNKIYRWSGSIYIEIASNQAIWGAITGTLTNQTDLVNALNLKADKTITITPNAPLTGGGDLSANRSISINQSGASSDGFLSSTDWTTFNNKQNALNGTGFVKISGTTISYDNSTYALDSVVVKLTGNQTIEGVKTFTSQMNAAKIIMSNTSLDRSLELSNSSLGQSISVTNTGSGNAIQNFNNGNSGVGFMSANSNTAFGNLYQGNYNGTRVFSVGSQGNGYFSDSIRIANIASPSLSWDLKTFGSQFQIVDVNGNSERFVISATGNVGIGTTSPNVRTEIAGTEGIVALRVTTDNGGVSASNYSEIQLADNGTVRSYWRNLRDGSGDTLFSYNLNLRFLSGSTERMRIASSGNVGIGTTSPSSILDIRQDNLPRITLVRNGVISWFIGNPAQSTSNNFSIGTDSGGNTNILNITNGGNVGIGTSSPESGWKLDVSGIVTMGSSSGNGRLYISTDNTTSGTTYIQARNLTVATPLFYTASSHTFDATVKVNALGTGLVYSNAGVLTSTNPSDERLKDDITDLEYGLNEILKLRPVSYNWKNDTINQGKQFGFIAQEVQEVMPELVKEFTTTEDEEEVVRLGLDKEGIYAALVNAIKELKAEIEILKNK